MAYKVKAWEKKRLAPKQKKYRNMTIGRFIEFTSTIRQAIEVQNFDDLMEALEISRPIVQSIEHYRILVQANALYLDAYEAKGNGAEAKEMEERYKLAEVYYCTAKREKDKYTNIFNLFLEKDMFCTLENVWLALFRRRPIPRK